MLPRSHVAIVPLRRLGRCRLGPPLRMTVSSKPNSLCELDAVGGAQCTMHDTLHDAILFDTLRIA